MELYLSALISGIGLGCLYGLSGFAIVLIYKSTGVANFAHGALATLFAFAVLELMGSRWSLSVLEAVLVCLVLVPLLGVLIYAVVLLPGGASAGHLNLTVRTLGLSLLLVAIMELVWGAGAPYRFPPLVSGVAFQIGSLSVSWLTVLASATTLIIAGALVIMFQVTNAGLLFRAVAQDPETARLLGVRTGRLGAAAWAIASLLALAVGVLIAPTAFVSPVMMESYLLLTFTAIILGGLTSLPGALLGGVIVGVLSNVTTVAFNLEVSTMVMFLLLVTVLIVRPQGILGESDYARL